VARRILPIKHGRADQMAADSWTGYTVPLQKPRGPGPEVPGAPGARPWAFSGPQGSRGPRKAPREAGLQELDPGGPRRSRGEGLREKDPGPPEGPLKAP